MGSSESNDYSKMAGYPFITKCFSCENNENIIWCHACDEGLETIDDEGNIHCKKCTLDKFLLDLRYDCGEHNNQFLSPNYKRAMYAISQLATSKVVPDCSCEKICQKIIRYKDYNQSIEENSNCLNIINFNCIKKYKI